MAGAATAGYAWWATSLRPFTSVALAATLAGGLVAVAVGAALSRVPRRGPAEGRAGRPGWLVLLVGFAAWELASFLQHPRSEHPTMSSLANGALSVHPVRALAMVLWLALGLRIVRR